MGKGLPRITRARRAKLPLVINEGKTRPLVLVIATILQLNATLQSEVICLCSGIGRTTRSILSFSNNSWEVLNYAKHCVMCL
jgi:hypothetical protein